MTTLITGANRGRGLETAKALGLLGHDLILTVRTEEKKHQLGQDFPYPERIKGLYVVEFTDMESVSFAARAIATDFPGIDNLIFCAGTMSPQFGRTQDGWETHFQVNFLAQISFFLGLQSSVYASLAKKVIVVSSPLGIRKPGLSLEEILGWGACPGDDFDFLSAYQVSRWAQVLFVREMDRRFGAFGVKGCAVLEESGDARDSGFITPAFLASHPVACGGLLWSQGKPMEPDPVEIPAILGRRLWDWAEAYVECLSKKEACVE